MVSGFVLAAIECGQPASGPFRFDFVEQLSHAEEVSSAALFTREVYPVTNWQREKGELPSGSCSRWTTHFEDESDAIEAHLELLRKGVSIPRVDQADGSVPLPFWIIERAGVRLGPYMVKADFRFKETRALQLPPVDGLAKVKLFALADPTDGQWPLLEVGVRGMDSERFIVALSSAESYEFPLTFPSSPCSLEISIGKRSPQEADPPRNVQVSAVEISVPYRISLYTSPQVSDATEGLAFRQRPISLTRTLTTKPESLAVAKKVAPNPFNSVILETASLGGEALPALFLPPPSRIAYALAVPERGFLEFAVLVLAFGSDGPQQATVRWHFETAEGKRVALFERSFDSERWSPELQWQEFKVPLKSAAAGKGRLTVETDWFPAREEALRGGDEEDPLLGVFIGGPQIYASPATNLPKNQQRPNVIVISIDTLRADHLTCYGYHRETTPNIDAVAREGVLFEEAYSTAAWTLPAHASLFSSLLPSTHGANESHDAVGPIPDLIGYWFRSLDYRRGAFTDGVAVAANYGFARGFDLYRDRQEGIANIVDHALSWWDEQPSGIPKMMFLHCYDVHSPYGAAEEFRLRFHPNPGYNRLPYSVDLFGGFLRNVRLGVFEVLPEDIEHMVALYDGDLYYTDQQLGTLFNHLRKRKEWDQTLLIILSDHGEEFMEHGDLGHCHTLYEEVVHIPLIFKMVGGQYAGTRVKCLASLIDILPTIADALGEPPSEIWQGKNLVPLMASTSRNSGLSVFAEHGDYVKEITSDYSLIVKKGVGEGDLTVELFDRRSDRAEQSSLSEREHRQARSRADRLLRKQEEWRRLKMWQEDADLSDETRERLRQMGYLN